MTGVRGKDRTPGEFRRMQVAIGENHRFIPPPPQAIPDCLDAFEKYLHAPIEFDPIITCFLSHYQFETIHPFTDGNGRVGRLLLALMLYRQCQLTKPWLYLSEYFERQKTEYCRSLFEVSSSGNWERWLEFCLEGTVAQSKATIRRCERLQAIREDYMRRAAAVKGSVRLTQIVELLFESPFVRVNDLRKKLHISYPTAKSDVGRLEGAGILEPLPNTNLITYYAPEVFNIAYENLDA